MYQDGAEDFEMSSLTSSAILLATLLFTLCMLLYTVRLYYLSKVSTECLSEGTDIDIEKNILQIRIQNKSHTAQATFRANIFVDNNPLKVKSLQPKDVLNFYTKNLREEDLIRTHLLYPRIPGRGPGFLPWRTTLDPLDHRLFSVEPFPPHKRAARKKIVSQFMFEGFTGTLLEDIDQSLIDIKDSLFKSYEQGDFLGCLNILRRATNYPKFQEFVKEFESFTGLSPLDPYSFMPNLVKNAVDKDENGNFIPKNWENVQEIKIKIEQTGDEYTFKKSKEGWDKPKCCKSGGGLLMRGIR